MISEEQLSTFEDIALDCCFQDLQNIILELVEEVRRLQKECEEWKGFALYD